MAQITPESDGRWTLWDHGVLIHRFSELDQAVHAVRDYMIEKNARPESAYAAADVEVTKSRQPRT